MRWRLILIASQIVAAIGAVACVLCFRLDFARLSTLLEGKLETAFLLTLLVPFAASIYASIFVYRHTARRRLAQAVICFSCSLLLCAALATAIISVFIFFNGYNR